MEREIIAHALDYVKKAFENDFGGHDYFHTFRVYKMATRIATEEHANVKIVLLAALLHDVDDIKLSPQTHASKANARRFLAENNADEATVSQILGIIDEISFAGTDSVTPSTLEGKCAQDADRLDAIGAIGIGRAFAYGGSHNRYMHHPDIPPKQNMGKEEYRNHNATTINHFYEKLLTLTDMMNTPTARKLAKAREAYMKEFLSEFLSEWDGIR